jgi:hypothetical protein
MRKRSMTRNSLIFRVLTQAMHVGFFQDRRNENQHNLVTIAKQKGLCIAVIALNILVAGQDLNLRPSGYEAD